MDTHIYDMGDIDIAWCPGCGNYSILKIVKLALAELDIKPHELVLVSGIGQAAKIPHYFRTNFFNGLHGRAIPPATAIKAVNPGLTVIAESGDGDMYGEGGNHFIHAIRRNPDITNIVHNNMVYGLTKGQASPTSQLGFRTPVQVKGVFLEPLNPIALAIALDASFVARTYAGDIEQSKVIIEEAISHKGFALVDVFHPCVSFNKVNTHGWFKEHTYYLDDSHDPLNRLNAFQKAIEKERLPLGIFYKNPGKPTFEENVGLYKQDKTPLSFREKERGARLVNLIRSKK
ncbi:MAG: thiamine pyrophosphate-dependent enzyme [Candidatus Aminicenantes bacterium]|nr:thiamine pyrophosphate-dependent enzyme [Candidatus Aminicenantes bacterium]